MFVLLCLSVSLEQPYIFLLWWQVTPNNKQSSCASRALTFHSFSTKTHVIHNLEQGSDTLKLWRGHIHPNVQFSSNPVFFNRWFLNDYICSLKSCVVTSFGVQITRVTLNNLKSCLSHHVAGHHCQVPQVFISNTICPYIPGDFLAQAT